MRTFTLGEIVEYVPTLTKRQVQHFSAEGLIKPLERTTGTGQPRQYPRKSLLDAVLVGALVNVGVGIATIKQILDMDPFPINEEGTPIVTIKQEEIAASNIDGDFSFPAEEKSLSRLLFIYLNQGSIVDIIPSTGFSEVLDNSPGIGDLLAKHRGLEYDAMLYLNLEKALRNIPK